MSSFDDEFGLFGDDVPAEEEERRPTLGARRIASRETIIDEIEPEDDPEPAAPFRKPGGRCRRQCWRPSVGTLPPRAPPFGRAVAAAVRAGDRTPARG